MTGLYTAKMEAVLGYSFRNRVLLQEAVTHTSYIMATTRSYQRCLTPHQARTHGTHDTRHTYMVACVC